MRYFWTALCTAVVCGIVFCRPSGAYPKKGGHEFESFGEVITAATLDAASNAFTLTGDKVAGYGTLAVYVDFTHTAATDITMTCDSTVDGGSTYFVLQSCDVAAGDCTSTNATWTNAVAGDEDWVWRVDILGVQSVRCTFTDTAGGAGDAITVHAVGMTQ